MNFTISTLQQGEHSNSVFYLSLLLRLAGDRRTEQNAEYLNQRESDTKPPGKKDQTVFPFAVFCNALSELHTNPNTCKITTLIRSKVNKLKMCHLNHAPQMRNPNDFSVLTFQLACHEVSTFGYMSNVLTTIVQIVTTPKPLKCKFGKHFDKYNTHISMSALTL